MGFGGSSKNLAAQLKDAVARAELAEGNLAAVETERDEIRQALAESQAVVAQQQADLEAAAQRAEQDAQAVADASARAEAAQAEAAELKKRLANPGQAYEDAAPGRDAPVAEGGAPDAGEGPATWADAVKTEGDYVKARRKYKALWEAEMANAREKQTA